MGSCYYKGDNTNTKYKIQNTQIHHTKYTNSTSGQCLELLLQGRQCKYKIQNTKYKIHKNKKQNTQILPAGSALSCYYKGDNAKYKIHKKKKTKYTNSTSGQCLELLLQGRQYKIQKTQKKKYKIQNTQIHKNKMHKFYQRAVLC